MVTWSDVLNIAPELTNSVTVVAQNAILDQVAEQVLSSTWGTRAATGQTYLAAHLGTIRGAPNYQQENIGDHTRQVTGDLESTSYGREYKRLVRSLGLSVAVI